MISDLPSTAPDRTPDDETRLTLSQARTTAGNVDGGWWPRTTDPAVEFPALIAAADALGPFSRVVYNLDAWGHAARKIMVEGRAVRLEGFHTSPSDVVTLIGPNRTRTRLIVIAPSTPAGAARAALRAASAGDRTSHAAA